MKKAILGIFLLFIIAVGVGVYYVYSHIDYFIKIAIEQYGSQVTQTPVKVDNVKFDLQHGLGAIYGISVGNLSGYTDPEIFSLKEISAKLDLEKMSKDLIIIDRFTVRQPKVFYEINSANRANLDELKDRIDAEISAVTEADKNTTSTSRSEPKLIIRHVEFAEGGIQARVAALNNKVYHINLPPLIMDDLGGDSGAEPSEIAKQIFGKLTDQAKAAIKLQGFDKELDQIKAQVNQQLEGEKSKLADKAGAQLETQKQKAGDKLKSLINK